MQFYYRSTKQNEKLLIMKTIFLIIASIAFFSSSNVTSTQIDITYGRGVNCQGRGICSVETARDSKSDNSVLFYNSEQNNAIRLEVPINSLVLNNNRMQFENDSILVDKEILISSTNFSLPIVIEPNLYKVYTSKDLFTIYF